MQEIIPTLPDAHLVRLYRQGRAYTESESEGEGSLASEPEEDRKSGSVEERLGQNQEYMDNLINSQSEERSACILEGQDTKTAGTDSIPVVLIRKPTASNMSHRLLNPYIYRNIQNVGSLADLAALLETANDWDKRYNQLVDDGFIIGMLNRFRALPEDTQESVIQAQFLCLVASIARDLIPLCAASETKIIVGGILARYQYDLRSSTDPSFLNTEERYLIASEVKTRRTFASSEMWYHGSRGIQVLSAMYAFNCPTFLLTQKQWKLFVENRERNAILTFPYGHTADDDPHVKSTLVQSMGTIFLKAIVICLLSQQSPLVQSTESSQATATPKNTMVKSKYLGSSKKRQKLAAPLKKTPGPYNVKKEPSFVSGYIDGQPIYSEVRILTQEAVSRIEDEITLQEKAGFK